MLPRIGASIPFFGLAVVRQFEQMDVYSPNTANGIANSRDKLRSMQLLSRHDIGIPATAFVATAPTSCPLSSGSVARPSSSSFWKGPRASA